MGFRGWGLGKFRVWGSVLGLGFTGLGVKGLGRFVSVLAGFVVSAAPSAGLKITLASMQDHGRDVKMARGSKYT